MPRLKPVALHQWPNGMSIASRVFTRSKNGEPSDVIELTIKPARGRGDTGVWHLNVVDALAIIHCLSTAATQAIINGAPVEPER